MTEIFDREELLNRVDGDRELLADVLVLFKESCPRILSEMEAAIRQSDAEALARAAHTMKGSVGNFAGKAAFQKAIELEDIARTGRLSTAQPVYEELSQEIGRLLPALTAFAQERSD